MWQNNALTWPASAGLIQTTAETVTQQVGSTMSAATGRLTNLQSDANLGRHPLSAEAEALLNLRGELNTFLNQGTVLSVTPYQFQMGERVESGCYLSPANATKTLAAKLRDLSDTHKPKGQLYAVAIMVSTQSLGEFVSTLSAVTRVFPLPDWCQCYRQAEAMSKQEAEKLHQPAGIIQPRFKPYAHLNANPLNDYFAAQGAQIATLESLASDSSHVIGKLSALAQKRANRLSEITATINALKSLSGSVYSIKLSGTPESIATQLEQAAAPSTCPHTIASVLISSQQQPFFEELLCSH
ncbi:hypothetical protein NMR78_003190 [Vibrio cholerae]|uniref:hypothetical protein n=1 Tax=Vibrio cholerae TaxID=666 RepID=UPI000E0A695A|nr:hypothetical protein [Vibrio cholerae]EJL6470710.1 hypothetical protein [Vibrio cholerae]EJL6716737.1 hypothetical protein [Vibrio cholerae]EKF9635351.1 hypothetical protein [Vibrio cholerae]